MAPNGSVFNGTSCDSPINPVATRGALGITFAVLYAMVIVFVCVHLRKHGATHLPPEKRFRLVSRRWQWYWLLATCACGMISGFTAIDIDRDYLMGTSFVLSVLFYWVMLPTTLAAVWEMTRHWGSFMERQIVEGNPFELSQEDRRSKIEFYVPLVFYLFAFLVCPPLQLPRLDPTEQLDVLSFNPSLLEPHPQRLQIRHNRPPLSRFRNPLTPRPLGDCILTLR